MEVCYICHIVCGNCVSCSEGFRFQSRQEITCIVPGCRRFPFVMPPPFPANRKSQGVSCSRPTALSCIPLTLHSSSCHFEFDGTLHLQLTQCRQKREEKLLGFILEESTQSQAVLRPDLVELRRTSEIVCVRPSVPLITDFHAHCMGHAVAQLVNP